MDKVDIDVLKKYVDKAIHEKYDFYNYGHALEILHESFFAEWSEIQKSLFSLSISSNEILRPGGNESPIPQKFNAVLHPLGWREIRISGDLIVKKYQRRAEERHNFEDNPFENKNIKGYIDGHNIDFIKNKVAFDLEWNSKDQTFDRDLLAMRTYFDCGLIDVGIIVTRAQELNEIFKDLNIMKKYGASTTWIGKLLYRLDSRRNGGCPILAIGIKKECVSQ